MRWQILSVKGYSENALGFVGHLVCVITTPEYPCTTKPATDVIRNVFVLINPYLQILKPHSLHMLPNVFPFQFLVYNFQRRQILVLAHGPFKNKQQTRPVYGSEFGITLASNDVWLQIKGFVIPNLTQFLDFLYEISLTISIFQTSR